MSLAELLPLASALSHDEKFRLIQSLLTQLAQETGVVLPAPSVKPKQEQQAAAILQRMADRQALSEITEPVTWQRSLREESPLVGRE